MGHSWPAGGRASICGAPDSEHRPKILGKVFPRFSVLAVVRIGPAAATAGPS